MIFGFRPTLFLVVAAFAAHLSDQGRSNGPAAAGPAPAIERLGKDLFRLGRVRVNAATREVTVPGTINPVSTLEFLANTPGGMKAYESALTLESDGVTFNTALVLIGLERSNAHILENRQLEGDHVELWIEVPGAAIKKFRAERLVFDRATNQELPVSDWIYSGSMFQQNGKYLADIEGILIGFVHSRAAVIEHPDTIGVGRYGSVVLNPSLGLQPGAAVTLTVKAVG